MNKLYTISQLWVIGVAFAVTFACGQAPTKAEAEAETKKAEGEKAPEEAKTVSEGPEATTPPSVTPRKALTKEEQFKLLTRLSYDLAFKKGNMFTVEGLYYITKGPHGTMGYGDVQYVGSAKDVRASCPVGFSVIDRITLSIAYNKGLLEALPTEQTWVWTSDKPLDAGTGYYQIMPAEDYTRPQDGWVFTAGFFYTGRGSQIDGQIYCSMSIHDLPKIEDMPDYMQQTIVDMGFE